MDVEGSAGVRQQNFKFVFPAPKHQQTGADSTSLRFSIFTHPSFCTGNALDAFCKSCARFVFAAQASNIMRVLCSQTTDAVMVYHPAAGIGCGKTPEERRELAAHRKCRRSRRPTAGPTKRRETDRRFRRATRSSIR